MKKTTKKEWVYIIVGSLLLALGVVWFAESAGLVAGGISGVAIVIFELTKRIFGTGVPLTVTNIVFNLPLFIISIRQRGFGFAKKSLYAVLFVSLFLWAAEYIPNPFAVGDDLLLAGAAYGALSGLGVGIVLKSGATTGGTDMLASILKHISPHMSIPALMLFVDGVIILCGYFIFGAQRALYAVIAIIIGSYTINAILEGMHYARAAFIISDKAEEISQKIMQTVGRGNTGIRTRGMYTGKEQMMLFVVVSPKQLPSLRRLVKETDSSAFMIITDIKEALGEGFTQSYDTLTM